MVTRAFVAVVAFAALPCPAPPRADAAARVPVGTYVYVHNRSFDGNIRGYSLAADGTLEELPGSPFDISGDGVNCTGYCETLGWSKKRKMLFAGTAGGIVALRVHPGGALEEVAGSPFVSDARGGVVGTAAMDRGRQTFVYGAVYAEDTLLALRVEPDGTLAPVPGSPLAVAVGPDGVAAAGKSVFVATEDTQTIAPFRIGRDGSAAGTAHFPFTDRGSVYNVNPDPSGKFVYVATCDDEVAVLRVDPRTSALAAVEGSPVKTLAEESCSGIAVSRRLAAVPRAVGGPSDNVQVFRRERSGMLTALGGLQSSGGTETASAAFDPSGRFLVLAGASSVRSLAVDAKSGVLSPVSDLSFPQANVTAVVVVRR